MEKKEIRDKYKNLRKNMDYDLRKLKSQRIFSLLFQMEEYKKAENIFLFYNFGAEILTSDFFEEISKEKKLYIPRAHEEMIFFEFDRNNLEKSSFGILEPKKDCFSMASDEKTAIIVPGLCFSKNFYRIGYGGGYYDRYLKNNIYLCAIGICFYEQIVEQLPLETYDMPVDFIVTDKEVFGR